MNDKKFNNNIPDEIIEMLKNRANFSIEDICLVINAILVSSAKRRLPKRHFLFYAFHAKHRYFTFNIPKKKGNVRRIYAPVSRLRQLQKALNEIFQIIFTPNESVHGFVKGRSIVTNAQKHFNKNYIFNADLKDFFDNISFRRIKTILQLPPFCFRDETAFFIANLCCHEGHLPQGAPTSPVLSNTVCQRLDRKLAALAKEYKIRYSRYADDITFSSYLHVFDNVFQERFRGIINEENFTLNEEKVRIQSHSEKQEVTGLIVNKKINVNRKYILTIRQMLHNWACKGETIAQNIFLEKEPKYKSTDRVEIFAEVLGGRINFLGMVRGTKDPIYIKFFQKYEKLSLRKERPIVDQYKNLKGKHSPTKVVSFLENFRKPNNTGLRELLHTPNNPSAFNLQDTLDKIANEFPWLEEDAIKMHYKSLPLPLFLYLRDLIKIYKKQGLDYWLEFKQHPLFSLLPFTEKILKLKRALRLGYNRTESFLLSDIFNELFLNLGITDEGKNKNIESVFLKENISFVPEDAEDFNSNLEVFTHVPSIRNGVLEILIKIIKYSNFQGIPINNENKKQKALKIETTYSSAGSFVFSEIKITDVNSICLISPQKLIWRLNKTREYFWSLCDWKIVAPFKDGSIWELNMMFDPREFVNEPIQIDKRVEGFTHVLKFYHK